MDSNVWGNVTVDELKQDAEKALIVLIQQPEVDANHVTLLGHSEGAIIAPRVAIDNPGKVDNIVLMGSVAQNLRELAYFQIVTNTVHYAQQVLDHNHNGLLSVQEASENPVCVQQAFLLQQELTEVKHPDHTLITYPDLGHLFYPSSQWLTAVGGPIEPKVLEDLFGWLSDPVGDFKKLTILSSQIP